MEMNVAKRLLLLFLFLAITAGYSLAQGTSTPAPLPSLTDLKDGWNEIDPGGDTICSQGTPYKFFVHPAKTDKLLIYFQGGGACWNGQTCGPQGDQGGIYTTTVEFTTTQLTQLQIGIFGFGNSENPFGDYNTVFIPYCTGDVHMGDRVATYGTGSQAVTIYHKGFANAQAALDWTYANFPTPERVFVTGSSAGALGSIFHAPFIMEHYQDVPVTQLGDAAGGYRAANGELATQFEDWGTVKLLPDFVSGLAGLTSATLSFEKLYIAAAAQYPERMFAQYNAANDQVQAFFLKLTGGSASLTDTLPADLADIAASALNFRYVTEGGDVHTILLRPEFYTYAVNGVRIRDWVNDLANGATVENEVCSACDKPEVSG
jgi:Pectinacetylesterase